MSSCLHKVNNLFFFVIRAKRLKIKPFGRLSRSISIGCIPLGLNISDLPFEWYDLLIVILIIFTLYQLGKRRTQFIKLIIEDYPYLKVYEKKILFISRLFLSFLILFIVSYIIGDLFFNITNNFLVTISINNESVKFIKVIKYFLVLILKPLLIYINYRLHGIKSWRLWIVLFSSIFFVSFLIISFSNYWNLTIYQEISAFFITLSLSLVSLSNFGELGVCNMVPKRSSYDISSKNENLNESKSQKDNYNSEKNNNNIDKDKKSTKSENKRKVGGNNFEDKKAKKRILKTDGTNKSKK